MSLGFEGAIGTIEGHESATEREDRGEDGTRAEDDVFGLANFVDAKEGARGHKPEDAADREADGRDSKDDSAELAAEDAAEEGEHAADDLEDEGRDEQGHAVIGLVAEHDVVAVA